MGLSEVLTLRLSRKKHLPWLRTSLARVRDALNAFHFMNLGRTLLRVFPKYSLLPQLTVHWIIQLPNPQFGGHSCRLPVPHLPTSKIHHWNLSVLPPKSFIATVLIWSTSISHLNHCLPLIMGYTIGGLSMCLGYQEDGNTFPPLPHKHTKQTKKGGKAILISAPLLI